MSAHTLAIRVYYEDTDFSGNVYHAAYLHFMERGRTEMLRAHGVHHSELAAEGLAFAVRSMQLEFIGAAHIDDELAVLTDIGEVTGARLALRQRVVRQDKLLVEAAVTVVAIRAGRAVRLPRRLLAALSIQV